MNKLVKYFSSSSSLSLRLILTSLTVLCDDVGVYLATIFIIIFIENRCVATTDNREDIEETKEEGIVKCELIFHKSS
jgi:hypothetical protein